MDEKDKALTVIGLILSFIALLYSFLYYMAQQ